MPLLPYPHLALTLNVDLTFCDGAHEWGAEVDHFGLEAVSVLTIVPPRDDNPEWPPTSEADIRETISQHLRDLLTKMGMVFAEYPGLAALDPAIAARIDEAIDDAQA